MSSATLLTYFLMNLRYIELDKVCHSLILKILTLFVNTLTTNYKYSCRNMLNFLQQLEAPFSQKQNTFSGFFIAFLKFALNLEHLEKKDEYPR